jgi:tetratricopeptide (TPR) repeat protein
MNRLKGDIMKRKAFILAIALVAFINVVTFAQTPTPTPNTQQPKLAPDEGKLVDKIAAAPDPAGKLAAAGELIKKYPKTAIRSQVVLELANKIREVKDPAQKLTLAQQLQTMFSQPADEQTVMPVVLDALADANQLDQAFAKGSDFLTRNPESIEVLVELVAIGTEQAKKQNTKFVDQSIRYASQAIALAEANKKPADFDDASWQQIKTVTLPSLYQSLGLLHMLKGARADAKANYTKASQVAPTDPFNFVMIAALLNDEYQAAAKAYQTTAAGAPKEAQLKKVEALLDTVIDAYAHAIALSEGNAQLAQVRQQYLQDLESYYKYRHNNSTTGMQQLIDKYKPAPKP